MTRKPFKREVEQREIPCPRCQGRGDMPQFQHVAMGVCFKCKGAGKVVAWVPKQKEAAA